MRHGAVRLRKFPHSAEKAARLGKRASRVGRKEA
jgi:hypothetical protein